MSLWDIFKHDEPPAADPVPYPETGQDGGKLLDTPGVDPNYFIPEYPQDSIGPVGSLPVTEDENAHWVKSTKPGEYIPYVGDQPHGLDIDVDPSKLPVSDIDLIKARGVAYDKPLAEVHTPPVPVAVVDYPVLFGVEKRFATNTFLLPNTNTPVQIAGRRLDRTAIRIGINNSTPVYIGPTAGQVAAGLGFLMSQNGFLTLDTNQPVWAATTDSNVTVSVVEEYTMVEGSKRI